MANNNHRYSPYFQQGSGQDRRPQQPYPDHMAGAYQRQSHPAMHPSQTVQGQAYSQQYASNVCRDQGYANVNSANGREDSARKHSYSHNLRASVETTAPGSLAYASGLGQNSGEPGSTAKGNHSMQHLVNYNRSQDGNGYIGSSSSENAYDHRRSSCGGAANTRNDGLRAHQTSMNSQYNSTSGIPTINGDIKTPGAAGPDQQNRPETQAVDLDRNEMRSTSQHYQQPPRPTSASHPRSNPPTSQSPRPAEISNNQSAKFNSQARIGPKPNHAQIQSSQQTASLPVSTRSKPTSSKSHVISPQGNQGVASNKPSVMSTSTKLYDRQKPNNQQSNPLNSSLQSATNGHNQDHVTPVINDFSRVQPISSTYNQVPFTVYPSQVFNQDEFRRRQAATAAKVTVARQAPNAKSSGAVAVTPDESKKMELEMKQMIEKMRDYKAKDPSLFSHVWEQVKKGTPPIRASSQPTAQQVARSEPPADRSTASVVDDNNQLPSPNPTHNQLPLESELEIVDASSKSEINRGKFPAQRRRRGVSKASRESANEVKNSTDTFVSSKAHDLPNDAPEPSTTYEAASGTMQKAMESYHENLDPRLVSHQIHPHAHSPAPFIAPPEVVYVNGTGPTPAKNTASSRLVNGEIGPRTLSAPVASMTPSTSNNMLPVHAKSSVAHVNNVDRPSGGTIWPEAHKWKLATAAAAALTSALANAGKQLSANEILQILNRNPSYTKLCETLEARGFIIERGPFARTLLAAVPEFDSVRDQEQPRTPSSSLTTRSSSSSAQKPPMFGMLIPPTSTNPSNPSHSPNGPSAETLPAVPAMPSNYESIRWADQASTKSPAQQSQTPHHNSQSLLQPLIPLPLPAPISTPPKPSTKEEMARKRSFNDIVDLTQALSDDDDNQPPSKVPRTDHQRTENSYIPSNKSPDIEAPDLERDMDSSASAMKGIDLSRYDYAPSSATEPKPLSVLEPLPSQSKRNHRQIMNVVRVMNRDDALRRSNYNPKTICRDILVSSGKHPTMTPLNYHLDALRKNFDEVDNYSDLSTFRWDLVDPEGDSEPSILEIKPAAVEDVDMGDADDEDVESATATRLLNRRSHRRVNVAIAVNDERVMIPEVDVDLDVRRGAKGGIPRRGRKPRRDRLSGTHSMPIDVDASSNLNGKIGSEDQDISRQGAGASTNYTPRPHRGRPPAQSMISTPIANAVGTPIRSEAGSGPKRRGRPPGSKDKSLRKNAAVLESGDKSIRTHPRSILLNTTPARPSTLRQTMTPTDGVAVVIESPSKANPEIRNVDLGRPRKRRKASPKSRQPSSPNHQVYKCRWKSCPAKLHNLETLRKHIRLHRDGYPVGPFPCLWAGCGTSKVSSDDEKIQHQPLEFETETGWDRHMEGRHLDRYAWELGDGPSTQPSDADLSDYVSDSYGRQVTPIAVASGAPPDPLPVPYTRRDARVYHKAQGNRTEGERAAAERRAQELASGEDLGGAVVVVSDDSDSEDVGEQEARESRGGAGLTEAG